MSQAKRTVGRPKTQPDQAQITIAVDRADLHAAEDLVATFDRVSPLAMRHSRLDVLRAAIRKGLGALRSELEESKA
jgi:hypothetical protein